MSDLRVKVRKKIYTSSLKMDMTNRNNSIIVFLGKMSSDNLKPYVDNFLKDILKMQISDNRISCVLIDEDSIEQMPQKIMDAIKNVGLNAAITNKIHISFVTIMDDDIYNIERKIDIPDIEKLKTSDLGGFSLEVYYDFYGIFLSTAVYENRKNARKTIVDFLNESNGGSHIIKRVFHQSCTGNDYYRSAKSITFMILINLIEKIDGHSISTSMAEGDNYTWNTFALFEKNLAALVIYEIVKKLLENQETGVETTPSENLYVEIKNAVAKIEDEMKKYISPSQLEYVPVEIRKSERDLSFGEKFSNMFKKEKANPVEYRRVGEELGVTDLLRKQEEVAEKIIEKYVTDEFLNNLIIKLIKMLTVVSSIDRPESMIVQAMQRYKAEMQDQFNGIRELSNVNSDSYAPQYNKMIFKMKLKVSDRIISYYLNNIEKYVYQVQTPLNQMNQEITNMINDFAMFETFFEGIEELMYNKTIRLLSDYDDILKVIDVDSVIKTIGKNSDIFSKILASYFESTKETGEIVKKFGSGFISPAPENEKYVLYSSVGINTPSKLDVIVDEKWFREYEMAILFTVKNNISDCDKLPFQAI